MSTMRQRAVIRRRRRHHAGMPWKRALLLVLFTGGSFVASIGEQGRSAIAEVLRDPLSVLAQRSPGTRTGALLPTKPDIHLAAGAAPFGPTERVLAPVRTRPPIDFGSEALVPEMVFPEVEAPVFVAPVTASVGPGGPLPGLPFIPPAIGGDPVLPPPGGEEPEPPPGGPPPAIPEPATWATMILGFFSIGWALRRSRRRRQIARMAAHGGS